jgi:hypothetical protein
MNHFQLFLRPVLLFLILPTAIVMTLGQPGLSVRPACNLDYLMVAALYPWLSRRWFVAVFTGAMVVDVLRGAANMFYFQPGAFIASAVDLPALNFGGVLLTAAAALGGLALMALLAERFLIRPQTPARYSAAFAGLVLALSLLDAATTGNFLVPRDTAGFHINLATSSALTTLRSLGRELTSYRNAGLAGQSPALAATDGLRRAIAAGKPPRRMLVVLSESWGKLADDVAERMILEPVDTPAIAAKYEVSHHTVRFGGSTVPGEFRELCGVATTSVSPRPEQVPAGTCLPAQLRSLGYQTVAAHGFSGAFFNRQAWYPAVGFSEAYFARELSDAGVGPARCGSVFRGLCDADVFSWLVRTFPDTGTRQFLYWVTLNAHMPVTPQTGMDCSLSEALKAPTICSLAALNRAVLQTVADWAVSDSARDTVIVVVGDHPPPLANSRTRQLYDPDVVPYVVLWPRTVSGEAAP